MNRRDVMGAALGSAAMVSSALRQRKLHHWDGMLWMPWRLEEQDQWMVLKSWPQGWMLSFLI